MNMTDSPFRQGPQLSAASAALTHDVTVVDERGRRSTIAIPAERPLTVYVDKRELVTLMTLGGAPEALVLITGRQLEHWHTGSMTRRATVLDAIEPDPVALVHPLDLERLGITPGAPITIASRRGEVVLYARADDSSPVGAIFVPFCYYEAAINRLTNAALDPFAKIPEFKYCAVRVSAGGDAPEQSSFGGGQALARDNASRV